jgi:hypothetical protein
MSIEFASPVWDSKSQSYRIFIQSSTTISSAAQYIDLSGNNAQIEYPDVSSDAITAHIKEFVKALLLKDSQANWFSTRLRESSILRKLEHKWELSQSLVPTHSWVTAIWSFSYIQITTQGFTLHWKLTRFDEAHPQISSRFLPAVSNPATPRPASPEVETRQFTIQPTAEMDSEGMEAVYDIPYANDTQMDLHQQMKDRHALQEARLRLALAKLKAERLTNKYYSKYGEAFSEEEDSELSDSDSEEEH